MSDIDIEELTRYAKAFAGLTPEREALLKTMAPLVVPRLAHVTDGFYATLQSIPKAAPFLEGRLESLKQTHVRWLEGIFTSQHDETYVRNMYHVGEVHVRVKLPVEFMAGGITQIHGRLAPIVVDAAQGDSAKAAAWLEAINAALGFALIVMQESYQSSTLSAELEKFLAITGMSRTLFNNLAAAYKD